MLGLSRRATNVVLAASVALTLFWKMKRRRRKLKDDDGHPVMDLRDDHHDDEVIRIELVDFEQTLYQRNDDPISTLTWFQGNWMSAGTILKHRVEMILAKNPWLTGRVVQRNGKLLLAYTPTKGLKTQLIDNQFVIMSVDESPFSRGTPIDQLGTCAKHLVLKNGPNQPLFRVTVVPCKTNPTSTFAVIVSVSHLIADGYTFYRIHNMLCSRSSSQDDGEDSSESNVVELIAQRIATTSQQQAAALGQAEYNYATQLSLAFLVNYGGALLWSKITGRGVAEGKFVLVDCVQMEETKRKAAEQAGVPFVSTNDVLASWFFQNTRATSGFMPINFRNRLAGHGDQLAGNYDNCIYYRRPDSASPGLIRQSLTTLQRAVTKDELPVVPGFWETVFGSTAIVTNWSSFAKPNVIQGCQEDLHVPLYDIALYVPSTVSVLVIFRSGPRGLGLYIVGRPDKLQSLCSAPFLSTKALM